MHNKSGSRRNMFHIHKHRRHLRRIFSFLRTLQLHGQCEHVLAVNFSFPSLIAAMELIGDRTPIGVVLICPFQKVLLEQGLSHFRMPAQMGPEYR